MPQDLIRDDRFLCRSCGRPHEWSPKPQRFGWFEILAIAGVFLFLGGIFEKWEFDRNIVKWNSDAGAVKVIKKFDSYRFQMKFPRDRKFLLSKQTPEFKDDKYAVYGVWFCKNIKPCIPEGAVLTSLRYEDTGDCWDIKPAGLGYNFLQDSAGNVLDEHGNIVFDAVKDNCQ